jgi:hypothetical protein
MNIGSLLPYSTLTNTIANYQHPPNVNEAPEGDSNFSDGSELLFSMYLERADEEDKKMAESWKGDAEGILLFVSAHVSSMHYLSTQEPQTGLFSAVVATLLQVSIPTLQASSQDTSAINSATSFTPSTSAVWVNLLWFLSLVISLTCALLATLLQQWTRRYLRLTHPRCSPHKRARIRAFFAEGVERLHLPWAVEALPTLLHLSLFLFFAGLGVYLFGIHKIIFSVVVAWVGLCVIVYAYVTALPIIHKDSPYHAPLSTFIWFCISGVRHSLFDYPPHSRDTTSSFATCDPEDDRHRGVFTHGPSLVKTAEEHASGLSANIDYRSLSWTFDSLDQDRELELFFEGVPGFCTSSAVANPMEGFIRPIGRKLSDALIGLMDRTLSSSLVSEAVKQRRITICTKAISAANLFGPWWILPKVLLGEWQAFLRSIDFGLFLTDWSRVDRPITTFYAQCVVAVIISSVQAQARDERWVQLVAHQIGVSKPVLVRYLTHGDSILLASLVHVVWQTLRISSDIGEHYEAYIKNASSRTLECTCKLDARDSLPELQHDFCNLWNELVHAAQTDGCPHVRSLSLAILKNIRKVYIALHEGTHALPTALTIIDDCDAALDDIASYPMCTVDSHESFLPGGPPNLQRQAAAAAVVEGDATQLPVSPVPVTAVAPTTLPTPSATPSPPPVPSTAQVIPGHHDARPTEQCTVHHDYSAPHAPSMGTPSGASSNPSPQISPTPVLGATRLVP